MRKIKTLLNIVKIILTLLFTVYSVTIIYFLFFSNPEKRFQLAGATQGTFLSQKVFKTLISQNPNFSDAYFEKSVPFNKRGDYLQGFKLLNKAVEINPKSHLGYRGWLRLVKLKDYEGCIKDLKKLDILTKDFVDAAWGENIHYLMGISYLGLNKVNKAEMEFNKYLKSEKDSSWVNPNMFLYKGIALARLGDFKRAELNYKASLKYNVNSTETYFHYGVLLKKINLKDSSEVMIKKSLELIKKGMKNRDFYNEVYNELYLSDVKEELSDFD